MPLLAAEPNAPNFPIPTACFTWPAIVYTASSAPTLINVTWCAASSGTRATLCSDSGGIKAQIGKQFAALAVFDEPVGNTEPADAAAVEPGIGGGFQHGGAKTGQQGRLFHRDDEAALAHRAKHRFRVQRLNEPGIDDSDMDSVLAQHTGCFKAGRQQRTAAKNRAVVAPR